MTHNLTHEEKVEIFREIQREYHIEDAHRHVEEIIEFDGISAKTITLKYLTDEDYNKLASLFEDDYDCDVAENDQWNALIEDYIDLNNLIADKDGEVYRRYKEYKAAWIDEHIGPKLLEETKTRYENREPEDLDKTFEEYVEEYGYADGSLYAWLEEFIENELLETEESVED